MTYLESLTGEENFQKMLRNYISEYSYKSVTTEDFVNFFKSFVTKEMPD